MQLLERTGSIIFTTRWPSNIHCILQGPLSLFDRFLSKCWVSHPNAPGVEIVRVKLATVLFPFKAQIEMYRSSCFNAIKEIEAMQDVTFKQLGLVIASFYP